MSAVQKFIASARKLHAEETDPAKRWEKMTPLLQELIADPSGERTVETLARLLSGRRARREFTFLRGSRLQVRHQRPDQGAAHAHGDPRSCAQLDALRRARRLRIHRALRAGRRSVEARLRRGAQVGERQSRRRQNRLGAALCRFMPKRAATSGRWRSSSAPKRPAVFSRGATIRRPTNIGRVTDLSSCHTSLNKISSISLILLQRGHNG